MRIYPLISEALYHIASDRGHSIQAYIPYSYTDITLNQNRTPTTGLVCTPADVTFKRIYARVWEQELLVDYNFMHIVVSLLQVCISGEVV